MDGAEPVQMFCRFYSKGAFVRFYILKNLLIKIQKLGCSIFINFFSLPLNDSIELLVRSSAVNTENPAGVIYKKN